MKERIDNLEWHLIDQGQGCDRLDQVLDNLEGPLVIWDSHWLCHLLAYPFIGQSRGHRYRDRRGRPWILLGHRRDLVQKSAQTHREQARKQGATNASKRKRTVSTTGTKQTKT